MRSFKLGTAIAGALLVLGVTSAGCVADRPARNGVFNENQYVRKDFLIQGTDLNGQAVGSDPGWLVRGTVTETSTPNLLGADLSVWGGLSADINLVRFRVTSDKLEMVSMLQYSNPIDTQANNGAITSNGVGVTENVVNAWPATNVDLKYQVNLDGETTNMYQENQELDWQIRQWVKLSFDKNDMSDFAPLGPSISQMVAKCADGGDASATLVDGSFNIEGAEDDDPSNDYMEFTVQVTIPMLLNDADCMTAYGAEAAASLQIGGYGSDGADQRNNVTVNLKYSFVRGNTPPNGQGGSYQPWVMAEKDPIHRKYGPFLFTTFNFDEATQLIGAQQFVGRFDPTKPIVWYFDQNFPEYYKNYFRNVSNPADPTTVQGATNVILNAAHAANPATTAQLSFKDYNDGGIVRNYGDIRYNFLRWESDEFVQKEFVAVTMPGFDPRTGEIINENILYNDYPMLDIVQRIDAFLVTVGASNGLGSVGEWPNLGPCSVGETQPIVTDTVVTNHNANSTLFTKMQQYLNLGAAIPGDSSDPPSANPHLGPADFVDIQNETDPDFLNAYFTLAPYEVFRDPNTNPFVTPEGQGGVFGPTTMWADIQNETVFQNAVATVNAGTTPFTQESGVGGVANAVGFANQMRSTLAQHLQKDLDTTYAHPNLKMDSSGTFSMESAMARDARMCVCNQSPTALLGSVSGYGTCPQGSAGGVWETKEQWQQRIVNRSWAQVLWHEFGHSLGLEHNFMGSIDQPNFTAQRDANGNTLCDDGSTGTPTGCVTGHTLYNMLTSTVMEYNDTPQDYNWVPGWGLYDQAAIAFIYSNTGNTSGLQGGTSAPAPAAIACLVDSDCKDNVTTAYGDTFTCTGADSTQNPPVKGACIPAASRSGQANISYPYNDPLGWCAAGSKDCGAVNVPGQVPVSGSEWGPTVSSSGANLYERQFQRCDDFDIKYSPLCRQFDLGVTPSEIIANEIDGYEWQYNWRNFRTYHKVWNLSGYANGIASTIVDMRRFMSQWAFDWAPGNLESDFMRIGVIPPANSDGAPQPNGNGSYGFSQIDYYNQLDQKFITEMATQGEMVAAFDEALIQQSSGERPFATVYDKFYGDVTQQGIILDKLFAMEGFVGLWVSDNYDQNEAGSYLSSWGDFDGYSSSYQTVAETAVRSMIGTTYASYPYFIPTAVALFAQDTHSPSFIGNGSSRIEAKEWIGGWTFGGGGGVTGNGEQEMINFFKTIAYNACQPQAAPTSGSVTCPTGCSASVETCPYDVTDPDQVAQNPSTGAFTGPDGLQYAYAYLPTRNQYVVARQDRNIVTWQLINAYNSDIIGVKDSTDAAYQLGYQIEYTIDSYNAFEFGSLTNDQQSSAGSGS